MVNFTYLRSLLENYGFELETREEAQKMGLPSATGLFNELFSAMEQQIAQGFFKKVDVGTAENMTPQEKQVSFYNRFFVFKKIRHVDANKVLRVMTSASGTQEESVNLDTQKPTRKHITKLNRRININTID